MIQFFRKIRRGLLDQKRMGKYLLYAMGEIILVMVGILLALQVNNWNEQNKKEKLELGILSSLHSDLESSMHTIDERIAANAMSRSLTIELKELLKNATRYPDTTKHFLHAILWEGPDVELPKPAYEELRNIGFGIISNDTLKKDILHHYEVKYQDLISAWAWKSRSITQDERYLKENFYIAGTHVDAKFSPWQNIDDSYGYMLYAPYDADRMWSERQKLIGRGTSQFYQRNYTEVIFRKYRDECKILLEKIEAELERYSGSTTDNSI